MCVQIPKWASVVRSITLDMDACKEEPWLQKQEQFFDLGFSYLFICLAHLFPNKYLCIKVGGCFLHPWYLVE